MFEKFVDIVFTLSLFGNALFFVPQIIRIIKSKSAEGLSLFTFGGFNIAQLFTALHAYFVKDYILMWGFLLAFVTCGIVTALIITYTVYPKGLKSGKTSKSTRSV